MKFDFSGDYLNFGSTKDGDQFVILDEGSLVYSDKLQKDMVNITVEHNGSKKIWSPNNTAGGQLQEAYGDDSKEWIGKVVEVRHVDKRMHIKPIVKK